MKMGGNDKKYVCMNLMCGLWADEPGPCKRCGQPVEEFDESAPFIPGGVSEGHREYMQAMADKVLHAQDQNEGEEEESGSKSQNDSLPSKPK